MIKAIIFDCFGVLTATELWKDFIATLPEEQRVPAGDLNIAHDKGVISLGEFKKGIRDLTGKEPSVIETLTDPSAIQKNLPLFELIAELKKRMKIGLLSNVGSDWVTNEFLTPEERKLFDAIVLSHNVGLAKPDPRIFTISAEKLGVEPPECVFVDDGQHNCAGAEDVGMQAIWYQNFAQFQADLQALLDA